MVDQRQDFFSYAKGGVVPNYNHKDDFVPSKISGCVYPLAKSAEARESLRKRLVDKTKAALNDMNLDIEDISDAASLLVAFAADLFESLVDN